MPLKDVALPIVYVISRTTSNIEPVIFTLRDYGFITEVTNNLAELIDIASKGAVSLILIDTTDIAPSQAEGYCQTIKNDSSANKILFIMLQAGVVTDEQKTFNPDANVNLTLSLKQDTNEIVSQIRTAFLAHQKNYDPNLLVYGDLTMDLTSYRVNRANKDIKLGPTEFEILQCLMQYPHKALSRAFIAKAVWGDTSLLDPRVIDVHINRVRKALKLTPEELPMIKTARSLGCCLQEI